MTYVENFAGKGPMELATLVKFIINTEGLSQKGEDRLMEIVEKMSKYFRGTKQIVKKMGQHTQ